MLETSQYRPKVCALHRFNKYLLIRAKLFFTVGDGPVLLVRGRRLLLALG